MVSGSSEPTVTETSLRRSGKPLILQQAAGHRQRGLDGLDSLPAVEATVDLKYTEQEDRS